MRSNPDLSGIDGVRVEMHGSPDPGDNAGYGNWSDDPAGQWFVPGRVSYSDYSGGTVGKANVEWFLENWEHYRPQFILELHGGHGTTAVALLIDDTPDEVWKQLEGLEDYPLFDDEKLSDVEMELQNEAWDAWGEQDFRKALEKDIVDIYADADDEDAITDEDAEAAVATLDEFARQHPAQEPGCTRHQRRHGAPRRSRCL